MKKVILLAMLIVASVFTVKAGGLEAVKEVLMHVEISLGTATRSHQVQPFDAVIDLNYHFTDRFSIRAVGTADYFLPKNDVTNKYNYTFNLGGGIGYAFLPIEPSDYFVYEARAFVTTSLNNSLYKNTSYNIGLYLYGNSTVKHRIVPLIGIGYSFKDYKSASLSSYSGAYLTLGLRF
jgi:hypothetical protein